MSLILQILQILNTWLIYHSLFFSGMHVTFFLLNEEQADRFYQTSFKDRLWHGLSILRMLSTVKIINPNAKFFLLNGLSTLSPHLSTAYGIRAWCDCSIWWHGFTKWWSTSFLCVHWDFCSVIRLNAICIALLTAKGGYPSAVQKFPTRS